MGRIGQNHMTQQTHGGKGSKRRSTDEQKYNDNWDKIFPPKEKK